MPLTVFTWGYEGWGNATRALLRAFGAVERERGFEPPVFADVRVRREVRAVGFRGDAFARQVGRERYRWLPGLGNAAVGTGEGPMRLVEPADVYELLGLIQAQARQGRRVVFFCGCGSPFHAATCHRQLVRRALLAAARSLGARLVAEEWPGGTPPARVRNTLDVTAATLAAVRAGSSTVPLGRRLPAVGWLAWPTGAVLRLRAGTDTALVSGVCARFHAGQWRLPLWVRDANSPALEPLLEEARRLARAAFLGPHTDSGSLAESRHHP